jgi:outer membrane protein OmpA-like peptidoglycan-associated protein
MKSWCKFGLILSSVVYCVSISAQQPAADVSVEDLAKALTPAPPATRSLRNLTVAPVRTIDLVIQFEFNSARIQSVSDQQLLRLATAMNLEQLQTPRFQVEGHTDAKGSAQYNQALSEKRAQAVAQFLTKNGIASERLLAVGKGFSDLLNKEDPHSADNRRVRIMTIAP